MAGGTRSSFADSQRSEPRKPGRVVLPGDRRRARLAWGLAFLAVAAIATAGIAGLRARDEARRAAIEPLSFPLGLSEPAAPEGAGTVSR